MLHIDVALMAFEFNIGDIKLISAIIIQPDYH